MSEHEYPDCAELGIFILVCIVVVLPLFAFLLPFALIGWVAKRIAAIWGVSL